MKPAQHPEPCDIQPTKTNVQRIAGERSDERQRGARDLRHTCATLLLGAGENVKVVSERLGHASSALTLDVYSHVLPDMQQGAADKIGKLLG